MKDFLIKLCELLEKYNVQIQGSDSGIDFVINPKWTEEWDETKPSYAVCTSENTIDDVNIIQYIKDEGYEY